MINKYQRKFEFWESWYLINCSVILLEMLYYNIDFQKKLYYMIECLSFINVI